MYTAPAPHKRLIVLVACVAACVIGTTSPPPARAESESGIFCYNIDLAPRGQSGEHCYSNRDYVQTATNTSPSAWAWVWAWNETYGAEKGECKTNGCLAEAEITGPGHGYEENANLFSHSAYFYGEWFSFAI